MSTVQEIERAIDALVPAQFEELCLWLEERHSGQLDARIAADLSTGALDKAIQRALNDETSGRVRAL